MTLFPHLSPLLIFYLLHFLLLLEFLFLFFSSTSLPLCTELKLDLTDGFSSFSRQMTGQYIKLEHDRSFHILSSLFDAIQIQSEHLTALSKNYKICSQEGAGLRHLLANIFSLCNNF
jgi:hypothetical protein